MLREEVEWCPYCESENIILWDVEKDGYEVKCKHCGEKIMLCDACYHTDDPHMTKCDWCEGKGCRRKKVTETKDIFRTIKFTTGMVPEFEIISTNAPNSVIKANMKYMEFCEEEGDTIESPYAIIEAMGYIVNIIGCQYDELENIKIDQEFDYDDL